MKTVRLEDEDSRFHRAYHNIFILHEDVEIFVTVYDYCEICVDKEVTFRRRNYKKGEKIVFKDIVSERFKRMNSSQIEQEVIRMLFEK